MNNVVIRDAAGAHFVVGCDCAAKTNDAKLTTEVDLLEKSRQRARKDATAKAEREAREQRIRADQEEQRARNGGKTDVEVIEERRRSEEQARREKVAADNSWLIQVLKGRPGDFVESMIQELQTESINSLSPRCRAILRDIYGKSHGRSNSKAWQSAVNEFDERTGNDE